MTSFVTSQKWACIEGGHEIAVVDDNNRAFITSLMEEVVHDHVEETDEERLKSVIQSLEAEINSGKVYVDHDSIYVEPDRRSINDGENCQSCSLGQIDDHDFPMSLDDLDMNGLIDIEVVPCSPSHDLNWYMYLCRDGISNDNFVHTYGGVTRDQEYGCNFLWQETSYDSVVYHE